MADCMVASSGVQIGRQPDDEMYLSQWQVPNPKRAGVEETQIRRVRTADTITVPPNWLRSEERGAPSLSLPLTPRISARARARRAYAHVRVFPGRDGAALCTAQWTKYCDDVMGGVDRDVLVLFVT